MVITDEELSEYKKKHEEACLDYCKKKDWNRDNLDWKQRDMMHKAIEQRKWFKQKNKLWTHRLLGQVQDMKQTIQEQKNSEEHRFPVKEFT